MNTHGTDTRLTPEQSERELRVFQHRLTGLALRLGTDCDRLLRSMPDATHAARRKAVGEAWLATRQIEALAATIEPRHGSLAQAVADLDRAIAPHRKRIIDAMASVLGVVPVTLEDELFLEDAQSIRDAAALKMSMVGTEHGARIARANVTPSQANAALDSPSLHPLPARILIVDDLAELRVVLRRQLDRLGYEVIEAENGVQALRRASESIPDIIISDLSMPGMDGFELLTRLKADERLRGIPVVVISGAEDIDSVVRSIELGAEDTLQKPYEMPQLQARLRASLDRKRARDAETDYLRRVGIITSAAEAVERNDYVAGTLSMLTRDRDALGHLARVFDRMVLGLKSREDRLFRRVRRLRSETESMSTTQEHSASRSSDSPFASGQVLSGRFKIVTQVGRGGMGTVYHAQDVELQEDIALKALRPDIVAEDPSILDRLKSEIRLARKLSHRNVLRAHDFGEHEGHYYITMEYIRGSTLASLLDQRGRLSVASVLAVGAQLAEALDAAHSANIIHRDVKPANMIVDEAGVLKVMDFGLARFVVRDVGDTQTGFVVGTPPYMAPEQLRGRALDARTDLFATGVLLYECLVGKPPFDTDDPTELMSLINRGDYAPITSQVADAPPPLESIVARLLRKDPDDRVQTARELADLIADVEDLALVEPGSN